MLKKINKRWFWTVMCRRTRQIIAFVIGDRSENTCRRLWNKVPSEYRNCISYSDFWDAYQKVLPQETHHAVGKDSGQVSHMERWYCTLRQHQARYVRTSSRCPSGRPFRFQSMTPFITWLPNGSSLTTIWLGNNSYHLLCDHYQIGI